MGIMVYYTTAGKTEQIPASSEWKIPTLPAITDCSPETSQEQEGFGDSHCRAVVSVGRGEEADKASLGITTRFQENYRLPQQLAAQVAGSHPDWDCTSGPQA